MTAIEFSRTAYLKQLLDSVEKGAAHFARSVDRAKAVFDGRRELTWSDLETLEALTARFARLTDILTRKTFRVIEQLELEEPGSTLDTINRAIKRGLIPSGDEWRAARELRNEIAHEYAIREIDEVSRDVLAHADMVLDAVRRTKAYSERLLSTLAGS